MPDQVPNVIVTAPATKPWWKSKTIWFNAGMAALTAAEASMGLLQPLVPVAVYPTLVFSLITGNAFLRIITTQGISFAGQQP
jgi:hypothetical protein